MKTKIQLLLALVLLPIFFISTSFYNPTKDDGQIIDENLTYFWYSVRIKINDRQNKYEIVGSGSKIKRGTLLEFEQAVWKGLSKRQIVIGPFQDTDEVVNSKMFYKRAESKVNYQPDGNPPSTIYWFAVKFYESERLRVYIFERTPASVQSGNPNQFISVLYEQLNFKQFSIGPFWDYTNAEHAKGLYLKNE